MKRDKFPYSILIVEDNLGDFVLVQDYLEEVILTPRIQNADSFSSAKKLIQEGNLSFDAILLDLSLPDKDGESLIFEMLGLAGTTPIIILTGYSDANFAIRSMSSGISDYLLKDELNAQILHKSITYGIERSKSISKLIESEQKYSELFHLSPIPMWLVDINYGNFLDVNEAAINHYGYSLEEFLSMKIHDVQSEADLEISPAIFQKTQYNQTFDNQRLVKHKKRDGSSIYVEKRVKYIQYNKREAELTLSNDVTDRVHYVDAIEKQNEKLKEIAWLQSHIVRAPLARLMGLVDMMNDEHLSEVEKEQFFAHITNSANELDGIIKSIIEKSQQINIT